MLNLSLKESRLIAKNRNIKGCKSMSKDELLNIIHNKQRNRKNLFKPKREEIKKVFIIEQEKVCLN